MGMTMHLLAYTRQRLQWGWTLASAWWAKKEPAAALVKRLPQ